MVGDGVNDALALSQAHFAVALAARSPVAMQVLQVSLSLYLYLSRAQNKP
jgi:P-type E1-E2 ATPase